MSALLVVCGGLLVAFALADLAWTTVAAGSGAGPLTSRVARRLWQVSLRAYRRWERHTILTFAGVAVVFAVLATWVALVLAGWALIFNATDGAVLDSSTGTAADVVDRLYFVGYTVFTLGNGDFRPGEGTWQLATAVASGTGLLFVTLSITYLVPVASAVAQRRQLASTISALGDSPGQILSRAWDGSSFGMLDQHLMTLGPLIETARQQHFTYPVLHYFHSADRTSAAAPNLVTLDDTLLLLTHGVPAAARPAALTLASLNDTIGAFLDTLAAAYIDDGGDALPPPSLDVLAEADIPVVDDGSYEAAVQELSRRRQLLAALLDDDGWR